MLDSARKWIAIRRYAKSLGPDLRKRYGRAQYYTPAQVGSSGNGGGDASSSE